MARQVKEIPNRQTRGRGEGSARSVYILDDTQTRGIQKGFYAWLGKILPLRILQYNINSPIELCPFFARSAVFCFVFFRL